MWCHFGISSKSSIAFSGRSSCFNAVCPAKSSYAMYSKTNETNPEGNNLRDSYLLSGSDSSVILGGHGTNTNPNKKNYPGSDSSVMVEIVGIEPMTSWMPFKRSTNWAISPYVFLGDAKNKLARNCFRAGFPLFCLPDYSPLMAPTGQPSSQAPQSMQTSGSIWYWVSPWEIAFTGQVSAQAPQEMQSSEILCAMTFYLQITSFQRAKANLSAFVDFIIT